MARRHELTDQQWDPIKDRIPGKDGDPGRTGDDNRLFVNAVLIRAQNRHSPVTLQRGGSAGTFRQAQLGGEMLRSLVQLRSLGQQGCVGRTVSCDRRGGP